jgi:hypothetical protein
MRIARTPRGPTLSFQVKEYSLAKHVRALQRRPFESKVQLLFIVVAKPQPLTPPVSRRLLS